MKSLGSYVGSGGADGILIRMMNTIGTSAAIDVK